jgi:hypothetical protein
MLWHHKPMEDRIYEGSIPAHGFEKQSFLTTAGDAQPGQGARSREDKPTLLIAPCPFLKLLRSSEERGGSLMSLPL